MTPLILLHGALGSAAQFDSLRAHLPPERAIYALNFPGHGGLPAGEPFSMALFSDAVLHFFEKENMAPADIFGYSMGGYVALYLAWKHPNRVRRIFTLGTKLHWSPEIAAGMSQMFDPEKIEVKVPQFAEILAKTHAPLDWKEVCRNTSAFLHALGNGHGLPAEAFSQITCPVTIGLGELDNVVTPEESRAAAEALPNGRFEIFTACKHPIEQVNVVFLAERLQDFFAEV
ncbi:MAG: alpha/beta hydrolase [Haliscomenobacteraceae bacterium CHB4]|nr:2-succinyl-6-hydroxy-2,4-cyclohexadiene-1-carboxylate synthase [Saprospiraceae bacterium]MCE7926372.1 alpha/beta hydrolase [Haliscomenobacteraceae bacterium CHB4]